MFSILFSGLGPGLVLPQACAQRELPKGEFAMIKRQLAWVVLAESQPDPYLAVQESTHLLLAKLVEVQPIYKTDPEKFYREVQLSLAPFIDFDGFSRGAMAKYYARATASQRDQFSEKFQRELVQTYANALVEFDNQKVEVLPLSTPVDGDRATVDLNVYGSDGKIYPIAYTLALIDGKWKLRNIVVDGINIGLQFRSQFSNYMQKYKNDIDQVIANWNVDA
jgi:phospholipid transport system substrate-binding protein